MAWFCVCIMLMIAAGALVYVFVINYDFGGFIPDDGSMREFIPEEGYERIPRQEVEATATPIPQPTPLPTPLPLDKYSLRDTRVSLPTGSNLDRADFRAAVSVETFADGEYKLGIVVHNGQGSNSVVEAYCSLDEKYNFGVEGGKIVG